MPRSPARRESKLIVSDSVRTVTEDASNPSLAQVVDVLERLYDPAWASDWDRVGLVCGNPESPVRRVLLAIDPVTSVVEEALDWRADLVITHHPLLLDPVHSIATTTAKGALLHRLVRADCALYTAHTNADVAAPGVSDALARVLGLRDLVPLVPDAPNPIDKIVTYVPHGVLDLTVEVMTKAGAEDPGGHSGATFVTAGDSTTSLGTADRRIEMLLPRARRGEVLSALRQLHPEDAPPVDVYELAADAGARGTGRVGRLFAPTTLREFALLVAEVLPATAQGVRISGDPVATISRVAVCGGSGGSLIEAARRSGADAYVTADLRHHVASEAREDVNHETPYLLDVAHWSSEWPWLAGVANRLQGALDAAGTPIEVQVSVRSTDPWTFRVPSPGGVVR